MVVRLTDDLNGVVVLPADVSRCVLDTPSAETIDVSFYEGQKTMTYANSDICAAAGRGVTGDPPVNHGNSQVARRNEALGLIPAQNILKDERATHCSDQDDQDENSDATANKRGYATQFVDPFGPLSWSLVPAQQ